MIPAERAHLHVAAKTHPGMSGKINEDRYAVSAFQIHANKPIPSVLAVVSDGIGGHRAGEVAAEIAVEAISQAVATGDANRPVHTLREAVSHASQTILKQSEKDVDQKGMGATCACGWVIGNRLYTVCVGDSRIYLLRGNTIRQISTDHTWIQEAIEHGALTPEQARGHPNTHVIRRYLGSRQPVEPDLRLRLRPEESDEQAMANQGIRLQAGDQILLCSDGLTDLVADAEILSILRAKNLEDALEQLVGLANERGGHDNITLVSLQVPEGIQPAYPAAGEQRQRWSWTCVGISAVLVAGLLLAGGVYWSLGFPGLNFDPSRTATVVEDTVSSPATPLLSAPTTRTLTPFPAATETSVLGPAPALSPTWTPLSATLTPWPTNTQPPGAFR